MMHWTKALSLQQRLHPPPQRNAFLCPQKKVWTVAGNGTCISPCNAYAYLLRYCQHKPFNWWAASCILLYSSQIAPSMVQTWLLIFFFRFLAIQGVIQKWVVWGVALVGSKFAGCCIQSKRWPNDVLTIMWHMELKYSTSFPEHFGLEICCAIWNQTQESNYPMRNLNPIHKTKLNVWFHLASRSIQFDQFSYLLGTNCRSIFCDRRPWGTNHWREGKIILNHGGEQILFG